MRHDLASFDLQVLCPVHSTTQRLCGHVVRITGFRLVHAFMPLEDCSEIRRFRAFLLEQGSFHFWMNAHDLADFIALCINASESMESGPLEDAEAMVHRLNVQPPASVC